jgi:Tol biopolymer transport system component
MRTVRIILVATVLAVPALPLAGQQGESADQQLKAAMHRELVGGDLRAAIKEYEGIVSRHRDNRPVAARALLQIAQCHDKLGQADARKVYEQIVRDYADQAEPVAQARVRLAAMSPQGAPATPDVGLARPLTPLGFANTLLSISPDGTKSAVIEYRKGMNLAVHDYPTTQVQTLTDFDWTASLVLDLWAAWSADGRRIAYTQIGIRENTAELRTTTLAGEVRTLFTSEPRGLVAPGDWMPDGRSLLVAVARADKIVSIGFIPAAGGAFTPLRSLQWSGGYPDRPRISPDGRFVLFADGTAGTRDIQVVSVDGRMATRITDHPAEDHNPVWSPDGRHVAFLSSRFGTEALWVVAVKDGHAAGDPVRVKDGLPGATLRDWTRKGLMYSELSRTSDLYTVTIDPAAAQLVGQPRQIEYGRTGRNFTPVWSPDGRHLAFISGSPAEPIRRFVVVRPEKGGEPREFLIPTGRYAPGGLDPYDLRWFGDGSGLGFSGLDAQGQRAIFLLSLTSGQWKTLPSPVSSATRIELDQTGRRVYYVQEDVNIIERDLETNQDRVVIRVGAPSLIRGLRLSPDRRSLAFTVRPDIDPKTPLRLVVADVQSGQMRTLLEETSPRGPETSIVYGVPAWSPDGRTLILTRAVVNRWPQLRLVPVDGSAGQTIVVDNTFARSARGPAAFGPAFGDVVWSIDGRRLVFGLSANRAVDSIIESVVPTAGSPARAPR